MSSNRDLHTDWAGLEREVFDRVRAGMVCNAAERQPTIVFLRELEETARTQASRRQTIQIIASGRRLLGDKSNVGNAHGQYAYCLGSYEGSSGSS